MHILFYNDVRHNVSIICGDPCLHVQSELCMCDVVLIILILHLSVTSVMSVRAGGHGKPFDPS